MIAGIEGESPSWLRHWILIPACEGSSPSSPAKIQTPVAQAAGVFSLALRSDAMQPRDYPD
jgi:hypothetical protein